MAQKFFYVENFVLRKAFFLFPPKIFQTAQDNDMNRKLIAICAFTLTLVFAVWQFAHFNTEAKSCFSFADNAETKVVYLTFDDGPTDRVTPKILDVLDEEDVKATFFIIGRNAERRKYLINREFRSGHTVAVHSYTHRYDEIYRDKQSLLKDIADCNAVIRSVTGKNSNIYRFPGGSFNATPELVDCVVQSGFRYVDWNAGLCDAEIPNATAEMLYRAAVATSEGINHVVMLAHDSTDKINTPAALKMVIKYFKDKGFAFDVFR